MKRICLLTMMCLLASTINLQAHTFARAIEDSTYRPLAKEGKVWYYKKKVNGNPPCTLYYSYFIKGDTTINDLQYKKLYLREWHLEAYVGAIRDEGPRAYIVPLDSLNEKVYYDISAPGTIRNTIIGTDFNSWDADFITINDIARRHCTWNYLVMNGSFGSFDWYEGIGAPFDLFLPKKYQMPSSTELVACVEYGIYIYGNKDTVPPTTYRRPIPLNYESKAGLNHPKSKIWVEYDDECLGIFFENVVDSFKLYLNGYLRNLPESCPDNAYIGSTFCEIAGVFNVEDKPLDIMIESDYERFTGQMTERFQPIDNRPFIEDGKMWRTVVINQNDENSKRFYEYWIHNNSYIDGQKFVKISRSEFNYDIDKNCPMSLDTTYIGMLFEKDGKVFYATDDQSNEDATLLYDFISPVGSEIEVCGDVCSITYKEKCQDEVFKGEKTYVQRKSDGTTTCWLEAVGTTSNPLGYALNADPMATEQELLISCTVGDEVLYYDSDTPDVGGDVKKNWLDFTHTVKTKPKAPERDVKSDRMKSEKSNDDFEANNEDETVTGEYSVKELFVNFKTLAGPYTITVTDAAGDIIYNKVVQTSNVVALNTDISTYPKGSYTITVENDAEAYTAEFNIKDEDSLTPNPSPVGEGNYVGEGGAGVVYDLSGRRIVNHKSKTLPLGGVGGGLSKGIYIINGRKVVVR